MNQKNTGLISFSDYLSLSARTKPASEDRRNYLVGLGGEIGELLDHLKKVLWHGHVRDDEKVKYEVGDVLWYLARLWPEDADQSNWPMHFDDELRQAEVNLKYAENDIESVLLDLFLCGGKIIGTDHRLSQARSSFIDEPNPIQELLLAVAKSDFLTHIATAMVMLHCVALYAGGTLDECAAMNVEKLKKRYPEGFTEEASKARVDVIKAPVRLTMSDENIQ